MEMAIKNAETALVRMEQVRRIQPITKKPEKNAIKAMEELVKERADLSHPAPAETEKQVVVEKSTPIVGNRYDYAVDSENGVVVTVRHPETDEEIKQIPSKEVQAAKRAYHSVVDRLFDETA